MDNKPTDVDVEPKVPAVDNQLPQDPGRKSDFWKPAFFLLLFLFVISTGFLGSQLYKKTSSEKPSTQRQLQESGETTFEPAEEAKCESLSQEELVSLLPSGVGLYELRHNGYNSNGCFYSINVFFPPDMNVKIEKDIAKDQLVGCWIIDLKSETARRIADWPNDYIFSKWVSEEEIELMDDDNDTASVFNVRTGEIVSRRVNQLNLKFTKGQDRIVSFKSVEQIEGCTFDKEMVQNWLQYPFDCVEKSDVIIQVDGYPDMLLEYIDEETIQIDGKTFGNLLDEGSWKIEL